MSAATDPQEAPPTATTPTAEAVAAAAPATLTGFSVSMDTVVWLTVIGVVAALRLARLEHLPLTIDESVRALASWQTADGNVPSNWSGDLTQAVTAYLFSIFGAGDQLARLAPALMGCLTVALCWPLARYASAPSALIAAVLLAISPLLIHVSRSGLPYASGAALSMGMVVALFAFLRSRSPVSLFALAITAGLALGSDAIATSTAIVLLVFLTLETTTFRSPAVGEALAELRRSRALVVSALLILLAALELGVTRFGTDIDRFSLPGLRLWTGMFELPRDSLPWHFHPGLLISYEAPALILGTVGYLWVLYRWVRAGTEGVPLFQRFLVIWASGAALIIAVGNPPRGWATCPADPAAGFAGGLLAGDAGGRTEPRFAAAVAAVSGACPVCGSLRRPGAHRLGPRQQRRRQGRSRRRAGDTDPGGRRRHRPPLARLELAWAPGHHRLLRLGLARLSRVPGTRRRLRRLRAGKRVPG